MIRDCGSKCMMVRRCSFRYLVCLIKVRISFNTGVNRFRVFEREK